MSTQFQIIFWKIRNLVHNRSPVVITNIAPLTDYIDKMLWSTVFSFNYLKKINYLMLQNQIINN